MGTKQDQDAAAKRREQLFISLYKSCFPAVARYVSKMGGSFDEAKDVFQDALLVYYEKQGAGAPELRAGGEAYLAGIARHLWLRRFRQAGTTSRWKPSADVAMEEALQPSSARILHYLEQAGQKCMQLLRAFYYDKAGLDDIASEFGFSSTRSATVQKFKCLEKVREKVKEKSLSYADFLE